MKNRQTGSTSVLILLVMLMLLVLGLSLASSTSTAMLHSDNEERAMIAFEGAQAGLEFELTEAYDYVDEYDQIDFLLHITHEEFGILDPNLFSYAYVIPASTGPSGSAWVTGTAWYKGRRRSVRAYVKSRNVSIWNNAIFAGAGQAGRTINGNVDVRGSMHLLGEGEAYSDLNGNGQWDDAEEFTDSNGNGIWDPGEAFVDSNGDGIWNNAEPFNDTNGDGVYDAPFLVSELSSEFAGTAQVGNNYHFIPPELSAVIPPPPIFGGVETLDAEVRVKHGKFGLSGQGTAGQEDTIDTTKKWSIDGSYVNDGYGGTRGADNVYSDNGAHHAYDLEHIDIDFPLITGVGAEEYEDEGVVYSTQKVFLDGYGLTVPINKIDNNTPSFSYGPDVNGNYIRWTDPPSRHGTGLLEVQGVVRFDGDIDIGTSKGYIETSGRGTLYSTQDINIHASILPDPTLVFPLTTALGFIAQRDLNLAAHSGDAQLNLAGAFYAQGTVKSTKQSKIAGTLVGSYFDLGNQIPSVFQVPTLVDNLPPHMPGDFKIVTLQLKSWRERRPYNMAQFTQETGT
jgi:hypothetical protein